MYGFRGSGWIAAWRFEWTLIVFLAGLAALLGAREAGATTFAVDSAQSRVMLSITVAGIPMAPQVDLTSGALGNETSYSGSIQATLDDLLNPSSIEFTSAFVFADDSGSWLPERGGGSTGLPGLPEPGNYGYAHPLVVFALRDLAFDLSSAPLPVSAGSFPSIITTETVQGVVDYNSIVAGFGSESLVGGGGTGGDGPDGMYASLGSIGILTLPVDFSQLVTAGGVSSTITASGQIVAVSVPEASLTTLLLFLSIAVARRSA